MKFAELRQYVLDNDGGRKRMDISQVNEVIALVLSKFKVEFKKNPFKATFDIISLIKKAKNRG